MFKEKEELQQKIQANTHEVYVFSFEEMDAIINSSPAGNSASVKASWQKIKGKAVVGANYYAAADDTVPTAKEKNVVFQISLDKLDLLVEYESVYGENIH